MHLKTICVFIAIAGLSGTLSIQDGPVVSVSQGTLLGKYETSRDGRRFNQFRGVPFGKVVRRFDIAQPPVSWDGVKNATVSAPECLNANQFIPNPPPQIEDCLFLEVSTPLLPTDDEFQSPLPVMVWIFGGGFGSGSGNMFGPKYLMDEDIVYVTLNVRLGAFGLLNAGIESARGNQALKDIVLALKWVQESIANFGGDPGCVTVFGESTGGATTSLLTLSKMAKGMFHRAIMQSGVANEPQMITRSNPGLKTAKMLAASLDCPTRDAEKMVECLRNVPAEELAAASTSPLDEFGNWIADEYQLGVTTETFSNGPDDPNVFITEDPQAIAERGDFTSVPMIIGKIGQEMYSTVDYYLSNPEIIDVFNKEFGRRFPQFLIYWNAARDPCAVTGKIRDFYFKGGNITAESLYDFERLWTDRLLTQPLRTMANAYSKYSDVYMYNMTRVKSGTNSPPSHAEDVQYLFNILPASPTGPEIPEILPGDGDYQFSKDLIRTFVNFARDGKPGNWGSSSVEWKRLTSGQPQEWLQITDSPYMQVVDKTFTDSWGFWNSLELKNV